MRCQRREAPARPRSIGEPSGAVHPGVRGCGSSPAAVRPRAPDVLLVTEFTHWESRGLVRHVVGEPVGFTVVHRFERSLIGELPAR